MSTEVKVCVDPGSTHMGKLDYCKQLIDLAYENRCWGIKFQLFPNEKKFTDAGNKYLPLDMFYELIEYCPQDYLKIFASVWEANELDVLVRYQLPIKFAYSQRNSPLTQVALHRSTDPVFISGDIMTRFPDAFNVVRLFCIPEYPIMYHVDFDELFANRFDGFSSHCLGIKQDLRAANAGAKWIEKHITLNHSDIICPDAAFALTPPELENLAKELK